jgi:hypothetical protein
MQLHARDTKRNATEAGFPLNLRVGCALRRTPCGVRRSKHRVLIFDAALARTVRETNDGPIYGCHHRSDAFYGGDGVVGRIYDVRRRVD